MINSKLIAVCVVLSFSRIHAVFAQVNVASAFDIAAKQYESMLETHQDVTNIPWSINKDGTLHDREPSWWCSGFFGGALWYLYEYTKDPKWKALHCRNKNG